MVVTVIESSTIFIYGFYYYMGGKDATVFVLISLIVVFLALVLSAFLPESPTQLYEQRKFGELRKTL